MNCPNCGHATPPTEAARCGYCNFKLPANPKPQAAGQATTLPCWNCRHANVAEAERCEHCNAKLQRPISNLHTPPSQKPKNLQTFTISSHDE